MHSIKEKLTDKIFSLKNKNRGKKSKSILGYRNSAFNRTVGSAWHPGCACSLWGKGVLPSQNGSVSTYTNNVLVSWTYPDAGNVTAVSHPDVSHFSFIIIPNFDQMVISTWKSQTVLWHCSNRINSPDLNYFSTFCVCLFKGRKTCLYNNSFLRL